jgi:hypothetical protein
LPDTPETKQKLADLLVNELPVGPDATNALEQLDGVLGDDQLYDQLEELAQQDANADARDVIRARMEEMGLEVPGSEADAEVEPVAEPAPMEPQQGVAEGRATYGPITDNHKAASKKVFAAGVRDGKAGAEKNKQHMASALMKTTYLNGYKQGEQGVAEGSTFPGPLSDREWSKVSRQVKSSQGRDGSVTSPHQRKDWYDPKDPRSSKQQKLDYLKSMKAKQGVAEAATPASVSKVLRLIQRHHPEWFDNYGMGEVEDTVVDMKDMGEFDGMSAEDALALVGQELESLYGQQGVAESSSCNMTMEGDYCPEHGLMECGMHEGAFHNPEQTDSPAAQAITRRILLQRTDLLSKYGPEKVGQAIDEVADFIGDVEEIGSSDVSGWVRHVEQMLGNMGDDVGEGVDDPINYNGAITGSYYESKQDPLARIKSLALRK